MLGKLLKYDLKSSYLYLVVCYAVYIVLTVMFSLMLHAEVNVEVTGGTMGMLRAFGLIILTLLWIFSIMGLVLLTYILIIHRFYSNLVKDEGYLSLTLPVSTRAHMLSKLISGLLFMLATAVALLAGVGVLVAILDSAEFARALSQLAPMFRRMILELSKELGTLNFIMLIVNGLLGVVRGLLLVYFSICLGQLFNKHKIWGSIGAFLAITIGLEVVTGIAYILSGSMYMPGGSALFSLVFVKGTRVVTWVELFLNIAQICVYFFLGAWLLEKKANLE